MVTRRSAKSKGNQFEYDVQHSLNASKEMSYTVYRTSERGFQQQYDLRDDENFIVIECKRLKAISWNQAEAYLRKLWDKAPKDYECYLIFKPNQQPCLVMHGNEAMKTHIIMEKFEDVFFTPFEKHPSTRAK